MENGTKIQPPTPEPKPAEDKANSWQSWFKEAVTAVIGIAILIGFLITLYAAAKAPDEKAYGQIKDLLLVINPLLGVVLGYYFGKVPAEARAEHAEETAKTASTTAQDATVKAKEEEAARKQAETEKEEAKRSLDQVAEPAKELLNRSESYDRAANDTDGADLTDTYARLRAALKYAGK